MSWPTVALDDASEVIRGVTFSKSDAVDSPGPRLVPILRAGNIGDKLDTSSNLIFIDEARVSEKQCLLPNDIVVCMSSGSANVLGKSAILEEEWSGSFGAFLAVVRARSDRANPRFLAHYLRSPMFRMWSSSSSGIGIKNIRASDFKQFEIPLPPLEEQRRIAAILDQADALRRLRCRALDRLNTLGQAIFHEMFGSPAKNVHGFRACELGEIIKIIGGSQPAKKHFLYEVGPDRVRFVQTRDFRTDDYKTYIPKELAKRPFNEDSVIIGRYGPPVFQIFRGLSGTYNVALMKAEPKGQVTKDFIFYLLQEPTLHGYVVANSERTAGQSGVNLALLNSYPVFEPPMPLQVEFSERLKGVENPLASTRSAHRRDERLFASLQHRAFRGDL